jgi:hypothetical protein
MTALPDLYLHPGIDSFEYPDPNSKVQYIGALPTPAGQPTLPEWIFTQPGYRERAQQLSIEFASHDVEAELLSLIEECITESVGA